MKTTSCNKLQFDTEVEKHFSKYLQDYPGINEPSFCWMNAQKQKIEMQNMNLTYLKNARNMIKILIDGNCCMYLSF